MQSLLQSEIYTLSFQLETVEMWANDAPALWTAHWLELGLDLDLEISPNIEKMRAMESLGMFRVITVRDEGKLIGYLLAVTAVHLHYSTSPMMFIVDAYYVMPEYRDGTGARLLMFSEAKAKELGAIKIYLSCKVHKDHSKLFEALGYQLSDYAFIKRI